MMAQKHLHELLRQDQEPFLLKDYIADRRCDLNRQNSQKNTLQARKRNTTVETSVNKRGLCRRACFFSFHDSPEVRKSPFPDFVSPAKTPNAVFLHIPTRTAGLLLEAAMRIQKQSSSSKPKSQNVKNVGFGFFGSILKRLKDRNRTKRREICFVSTKDLSIAGGKFSKNCEKMIKTEAGPDEKSAHEICYSCSCNNSRFSSSGWSETNEEHSLDLETSSSCSSDDSESEEIEFVTINRENGGFIPCGNRFYSSTSSPFRYCLHNSPSPGHRTPGFSSPLASPIHHRKEEKEEDCKAESFKKNQEEEEEEEKEQSSPVSVLDPPFADDDDEQGGAEDEDSDLDSSYAIVQRAKLQLLQKLQRFERLAELDPVELEKILLEEHDGEDGSEALERSPDQNPLSQFLETDAADALIRDVLSKSSLSQGGKITADMKKLLLDVIAEERSGQNEFDADDEGVIERASERLNSWKQVKSNTIDMMVELDFRREFDGWKKNQEQVGETAVAIEVAIFGLLTEELSEELCSFG